MSVRAKFAFASYSTSLMWDGSKRELRTLTLTPVTGGNEENKSFYAASPSGQIVLGTVNPDAWSQFELGKEYYVDFTPAEYTAEG